MIPVILIILFSAVKFAMTFPLAVLQFKFSFAETILWTNAGGILGIYFFAFLSQKIIAWWNRRFRPRRLARRSHKKIFTGRNRRIVRIKQNYGLFGIAFTTPLLLSIPVGTFLIVRYYRNQKFRFFYLIASNFFWSVVYTLFYMFWDGFLFKMV